MRKEQTFTEQLRLRRDCPVLSQRNMCVSLIHSPIQPKVESVLDQQA